MTNTARREPPAAGSGAAPFVEWSAIGESPALTGVPYWFGSVAEEVQRLCHEQVVVLEDAAVAGVG
jgi:hypothetical protein